MNAWLFLARIGTETSRTWAIVLGVLLAVVTIALLVASWTRWGQTKSLTKCIVLALLAHVWLLMYAYGTRIVSPGFGEGYGGGSRRDESGFSMMELLESMELTPPSEATVDSTPPVPSESVETQQVTESDTAANDAPMASPAVSAFHAPDLLPQTSPPIDPATVEAAVEDAAMEELVSQVVDAPVESPSDTSSEQVHAPESSSSLTTASVPTPPVPVVPQVVVRKLDQQPIPEAYRMRFPANRAQFAFQGGGDANTEASVQLALKWLANVQGADGSWNAASYGAGRDDAAQRVSPDGLDRHQAGIRANTGMTGLALLAFLGAGHTHVDGEYAPQVARGLSYLLQQQFPSGDLSGRDQVGSDPSVRFARMYCHGMASLALAEAYGMTGDPALLHAIQAASRFTAAAMNPRTGGWRYETSTEDPGDTSQFGWQAMVLQSAHRSGAIQLPTATRSSMHQFLDSVRAGRNGGLAVYRRIPGSRPTLEDRASPSMTAEAMASRMLLGFPVPPQAAEEAQQMLLRNLPGQGDENLYYWYYATIALYQLQGDAESNPAFAVGSRAAWQTWNEALKRQLCSTQLTRGSNIGSWNPTCIWGAYGGRIYSTTLACLSLEVYYRYLPMYQSNQIADQAMVGQRR